MSAGGTTLTASGQARNELVPPVGEQQPETSGNPPQDRTTISLRTHGSPQGSCDMFTEHISPPSCCLSTMQNIQVNARLGPSTTNIAAGNPRSERGRRTHHSVRTPSVYPPLSQHMQNYGTPSPMRTHLLKKIIFLPPPSVRPFFSSTSLQFPTLMRQQACPGCSPLHHQQERQMRRREQLGSMS